MWTLTLGDPPYLIDCHFSVAVMLQPFEYNPGEKSKHKFMVQTMFAPPGFRVESLDQVVSSHAPNRLHS